MTSEFAQQYINLSKEELLQLDPSVLSQLRQEMGDQEFIDHWTLTQEEYSYLINDEGEEATETAPVEQTQVTTTTTTTTNAPLGVKEVLYATRRTGGATTTTTTAAPVKSTPAPVVKQTLTTSSYVPTTAPVSENVWRPENPSYSIVHAPTERHVATQEPVVLGTRYAVHTPTVVEQPAPVYTTVQPTAVQTVPVQYGYPAYHGYGYPAYHHGYSGYHGYPYHHGYYGARRISTGGVIAEPSLRASSYVVRGDAPLRASVLRSSYAGPLRTSYVAPSNLRASYVAPTTLRTSYIA